MNDRRLREEVNNIRTSGINFNKIYNDNIGSGLLGNRK